MPTFDSTHPVNCTFGQLVPLGSLTVGDVIDANERGTYEYLDPVRIIGIDADTREVAVHRVADDPSSRPRTVTVAQDEMFRYTLPLTVTRLTFAGNNAPTWLPTNHRGELVVADGVQIAPSGAITFAADRVTVVNWSDPVATTVTVPAAVTRSLVAATVGNQRA